MLLRRLLAMALVVVLAACATRPVDVTEPEHGPKLKVRAHLAGTCDGRPLELFLRVDRSYQLEQKRWKDDYTLVDVGSEQGDWAASGSGYRMTSIEGREWLLEPPLESDPATQVFFIRRHERFEGCRLTEPH